MLAARILADAIVVFHAGYVGFVVLGMAAILVGLLFRRPWARNFWFRMAHLAAISVVVIEAAAGIPCPLTIWENALRLRADQEPYRGDFLGDWAHRLIFFDAPPWVFTLLYSLFAALVLLTFIAAPPHWRNRAERSTKT